MINLTKESINTNNNDNTYLKKKKEKVNKQRLYQPLTTKKYNENINR